MAALVVLASCAQSCVATRNPPPANGGPQTTVAPSTPPPKPPRPATPVCAGALPDLDTLHARSDAVSPEPLVVHIDTSDLSGLDDVEHDRPGAEVAVIFREGNFGASDKKPNATMRLRGLTVRKAYQKSYRIKLKGAQALWRGQRIIHLNKHPWDLSRVRQKLSFDLFRTVPHFASLDTHFAHVFMNGDDVGLYTIIENPDEHFLNAHSLPRGQLVMPVYFDFATVPEPVWSNPEELAKILEAKAYPNHDKLKRMIAAVNDPKTPINDVIQRYFDRKNYLTWLAANMVVGNWDMGASNYLIYSPEGCEGWYFLPWDYDGAWDWYGQPGVAPELRNRWRAGLTVYWGSALHSRFLREPANVAEVEAMMRTLAAGPLSPTRVSSLLQQYRATVSATVKTPPDVWYLPTPTLLIEEQAYAAWQHEFERLPQVVAMYLQEYQRVRSRPAPVWLHHVEQRRRIYFEWGRSYHFDGDALTYDFQLARSPRFEPHGVVVERTGLTIRDGELVGSVTLPRPGRGQYYWRVIVRAGKDPTRDWQEPFDGFAKLTVR